MAGRKKSRDCSLLPHFKNVCQKTSGKFVCTLQSIIIFLPFHFCFFCIFSLHLTVLVHSFQAILVCAWLVCFSHLLLKPVSVYFSSILSLFYKSLGVCVWKHRNNLALLISKTWMWYASVNWLFQCLELRLPWISQKWQEAYSWWVIFSHISKLGSERL